MLSVGFAIFSDVWVLFMERKRKSEGDFRQDTSFEGKEVFDCPGVDDDGETAGTVPRHAFIACRKGIYIHSLDKFPPNPTQLPTIKVRGKTGLNFRTAHTSLCMQVIVNGKQWQKQCNSYGTMRHFCCFLVAKQRTTYIDLHA